MTVTRKRLVDGQLLPETWWRKVDGVWLRETAGSVTTSTSTLPTIPAVQADAVVDAIGVVGHYTYDTYTTRTASVNAALAGLGVRWGRTRLYTGSAGDDQRTWMTQIHNDYGISFNVVMGNPDSAQTPADLVAYAQTFPAGVITSFEGGNEWNLHGGTTWAADIRAWQQQLWTAVKASPLASLPVLAPALGKRQGYADLGDVSAWCDYGNIHCYPGADLTPETRMDACITGTLTNAPGKPIITTECGYNNAMTSTGTPLHSTETSAGYNGPKMLLDWFVRGGTRAYQYEIIDEDKGDTSDPEQHFGLVRGDGSPKPAYTALQKLLALLADPGAPHVPAPVPCQITGPADLRTLVARKRDGSVLLVVWREVPVYSVTAGDLTVTPAPVDVALPRLTAVTALNGATTALAGDSVQLQVGPDVHVIQANA